MKLEWKYKLKKMKKRYVIGIILLIIIMIPVIMFVYTRMTEKVIFSGHIIGITHYEEDGNFLYGRIDVKNENKTVESFEVDFIQFNSACYGDFVIIYDSGRIDFIPVEK